MTTEMSGNNGQFCAVCGKAELVPHQMERQITCLDQDFIAMLTVPTCPQCHYSISDVRQKERMETAAALWFVQHRTVTGTVLRFVRKILRLTQAELGGLLGLAPETLCRLESGERSLSAQRIALVSLMLSDALANETRTIDIIKAGRKPPEDPVAFVGPVVLGVL